MRYTQLGRTGLKVSRLTLGTMNFGPLTNEPDSHTLMDAALDAGVNYFDTANVYGQSAGEGSRRTGGRAAAELAKPEVRARVQAYEELLDKHGLEPGEVAPAWLLTRPGVTAPIVGPRTADQLDSALRAVELELSAELLEALDEIFPGPGPAPESFAW
ncbi:aldo/keto reductase [Streptomyces sp. NPDC058284]|uniref:aldo/keto reductase n=1 Tax=unclassified Streptomyces TaxID=2593676 RepID=UPI003657C4A3